MFIYFLKNKGGFMSKLSYYKEEVEVSCGKLKRIIKCPKFILELKTKIAIFDRLRLIIFFCNLSRLLFLVEMLLEKFQWGATTSSDFSFSKKKKASILYRALTDGHPSSVSLSSSSQIGHGNQRQNDDGSLSKKCITLLYPHSSSTMM